ncbi:chromo domain protein LHP1 isoform X1 [Beta vulgaris subsp. vulgaris]|uniref:Heterochromatin protein isoform 2 n=1 Tax=Beta vulgaris subsp. vulgaris TaxID=3555 RepID=A0A059UEC9_BETVV|nr:chromo domain protein LHP1 isoform X1 [Beta vulgaris subsp. vulgaris]XP_057250896.1 chromo domain protein LHP1 isoform X1 [Beta vulgaris subsp. vulgaris]AHZ62813.1 heterochromatin protein isoform 2 [Beta vulgaris subsp. vulgaris]
MKKVKNTLQSESNSLSHSHSLSDSQNYAFNDLPPPSTTDTQRLTEERENVVVGDEEREKAEEEEVDGDEDDDEEEYEEEDEEEEEEDEEEEVEERERDGVEVLDGGTTTAERKKLADGYYEVESIRRKRICKGERQYLIKWRGWPESANTWEPVDHLQTCPDVVEAYEESLRSGQKKTSRKRKRKFTQPKKKMQYFYGVSKSKLTHSKLSLSHENETSATLENSVQAYPQPSMVAIVVEHDEAMKRPRATRSFDCKGSETVSPHVASNGKENSDQLYGQDTSTKNMDVHLQLPMTVEGDGPENCQSNANCVEVGQGNLCRGAKRRKSGSVRRFTPDMTSHSFDYLPNTAPANISSCDRVDKLMLGSSDACCKKKFDSSRSSNVITSLIKPISYSASVTNNVQDVAVTFVALRSDGKEVMVDNKFLKANNPHLLINFYEQHLRYSPN